MFSKIRKWLSGQKRINNAATTGRIYEKVDDGMSVKAKNSVKLAMKVIRNG